MFSKNKFLKLIYNKKYIKLMKIRSCTSFIKEGFHLVKKGDIDKNGVPDFLYHSTERHLVNGILADGLNGKIYLTENPEEAKLHHPIVLKVDVRFREVGRDDEGYFVQNIPPDQITRL